MEEINMSNIGNKFVNRMFRRISGLVWDITTGNIGLKTENGIYTLTRSVEGDTTIFGISVNPFEDFGMALPAFATQSTHAEVQVGDLIVGDNGIIGWVTAKTAAAYKVIDHNGYEKTYNAPSVQIMGQQGPLVVRNLFSLAGGQENGQAVASNLLPLMMMLGDSEEGTGKLEKILPLMLMSGNGGSLFGGNAGAAGGMNPMMMAMLLGGKNGGGVDMKTMMLMSMMGGNAGAAGGMNPMMMAMLLGDGDLGSLFGDVKTTGARKASAIPTLQSNGLSAPPLKFGA